MNVFTIPCLKDNFAYLLVCPASGEAAVVDPSEAEPVLAEVARQKVRLVAILNTHHHWDHVGGNTTLLESFPDLRVYGHSSDRGRIPGQTDFLEESDPVQFGQVSGRITHNPGHTTGAITYYFGDSAFTGDTLFAAGCGRLFEGSAEDMYRSLNEQIGAADPATKVYFGHEYTENNLKFALSLEPNHAPIQEKLERVRAQRAAGEWTTPTTLAEEWATNPFMRCDSPNLRTLLATAEPANDGSPISVLRHVRQLKDHF